ncbi:hypothetical protein [Clostridium sp. UBA7791]|uniref:hypothetical protein n=1 Tax=Clostridium sp. UBA7791 TaxID=1946379 RepID=UPI00321643E6
MNKKNMPKIGATVGLFNILIIRALSEKYGNDIRIMIGGISVIIGISIILFMLCMKEYVVALILLAMMLPIVIGFIGLYLEKSYLMDIGIISLLIIIPILIKIIPKYRK